MNSQWKHWIVSITDSCDNRCPGCYRVLQRNLTRTGSHMVLKDFVEILQIFKNQGGETIDLVGGEPTLHPDFIQLLQLCVEAGIQVWLYTNMRLFGRRPELVEEIKSCGGDVTIVGKLNVPEPTNSEQKRFQAQLIGASEQGVEEMWQGLLNLLAGGFPIGKIGVENLVRSRNIDLAPQVYEQGLRMGFFTDIELPTCPVAAGPASFRQWLALLPSHEQVNNCLTEIAVIDSRYGIPPRIAMVPHLTGRSPEGVGRGCTSFKESGLLTERDGRVALCTSGILLKDKTGRPFNILTDPLELIFQHPALLARRQSCQQSSILNGPCNACKHWPNCFAGCAALRETLGNVFTSYPICHLHEWSSKETLLERFQAAKGGNA